MADIVISVVAKVAEYLVAPIGRQLGYLYNYRSNLDKLEEQVEKLGDARGRLQRDVEEADRQGDEIEPDVQKWLTRAEGIIQKAEELIKAEKAANTSCFNLKLRYQRSRQAKKQSGDIGKIQEECKFDRVAYCLTPQGAWSARLRDCKALESRESTLKEIMKALRNDDIRMIGVWGMGGVGKTTLANQVAEKAEEDKLFEKVVMALNVTGVPNVTKIQGEIASMLGLEFKEKEESGRAARLSKSLQKKETVLVILDDIWEELSLENIGIPYGDAHRGCKVLLTSREHAVLSKDMRTQKNFHIQHLCEQEAWSLFKNTAGNSVEELELRPIALEVVKECEGLPVAIVTIAKALTGESVAVWKTALEELKRSAPTNIRGVSKNVYSCLELSYNHLKGDEVKRLFLLCGMLGYGDISLDQLLKYGMGLDLFERVSSLEQIRNKLVTLVKILKDSSLLLDAEDSYYFQWPGVFFGYNDENKFVKMHDVVGDVARAIAAKDPHRFVVIKEALGLEELQRKEEFRNCSRISLNCKDLHELPERLVCPRLEFFVLNSDAESLRIPDTFFEGTELLKVLDLSATYRTPLHLTPLPSSLGSLSNLRTLRVYRCTFQDIAVIGELKKLQVLSFASCEIERLPKEFMQLTDLRALELWECSHLQVIPRNVISSLSRLEHLCLAKSFTKWGAEGFGSGESYNACLSELNNLSYLKTLCIEIRDPNLLSKDLVFEKLTRYVISVSITEPHVDHNRSARTLMLTRFCLVDCFSKLFKTVEVLELSDLEEDTKHVLYGLDTDDFLQLKRLDIGDCPGIQYIVNSMKGVPSRSAFPILEKLNIYGLQNMDAVCYGPIPEGSFGKLRSLAVYHCKRLKSFISLPMEQGRDGSVLPEMGSLFSTRDFKTVDDFLQLKLLVIGYCPGIQYIVNSMKGVPSRSAFPILEELDIRGQENMDAVCYGPIPEGSFGNLRSLRVCDCKRLKSFISLPMEQGRDGSVLPEMGSLFSTRDFKTVDDFLQLKRLVIRDCPWIHYIVDSTKGVPSRSAFPILEELDIREQENMDAVCYGPIPEGSFGNLRSLRVCDCKSLQSFISLPMEQGRDGSVLPEMGSLFSTRDFKTVDDFLQLKRLVIRDCPWIHYIVDSTKGVPSRSAFPILEKLDICGLQNMDAVCYGPIPEGSFGKLRSLEVRSCSGLKSFVSLPMEQGRDGSVLREMGSLDSTRDFSSTGSSATQELSRSDVPTPFFNEQVTLPSLKDLTMYNLDNVIAIWHNQLPLESCCKLTGLEISKCNKLLNVFPSNILKGLQSLEFVRIDDCDSIEEIFDLQGVNCKEIHDIATIPLEKLLLKRLNSLKSVWNKDPQGLVSFQNLLVLKVVGCPCLKYLFPITVAEGLVQLEELQIINCGVEEIVANENGDEVMSSLFPELTSLTLSGLDKLKGFYRGTHIARGPHLKKLIMLEWDQVGTLFQEIDSEGYIDSPIQQSFFLLEKDAFLNLEQLILMGSKMKIYMVTSSMAKTLVQLKVLTIEECESVEEIVRHEGGEEPYDIVFSKLQRLRLVNLQSLKWFCSTRCIFEFPSLEQFEVKGCPQMEYFCETVPSTPRVKEVKIDDHVEEHFLGCDINTIIHNTALEKVCKISFF